jgi:transportin-1
MLEGLLRMMLENNKRVQEAGCSAVATLEEEANEKLIPYLGPMLQTFAYAFTRYQHRNLLILYDAVGSLAEGVGEALAEEQYLAVLMPPLVQKWESLTDDDKDLFPLLEVRLIVLSNMLKGF